jgi:hypothetical protein
VYLINAHLKLITESKEDERERFLVSLMLLHLKSWPFIYKSINYYDMTANLTITINFHNREIKNKESIRNELYNKITKMRAAADTNPAFKACQAFFIKLEAALSEDKEINELHLIFIEYLLKSITKSQDMQDRNRFIKLVSIINKVENIIFSSTYPILSTNYLERAKTIDLQRTLNLIPNVIDFKLASGDVLLPAEELLLNEIFCSINRPDYINDFCELAEVAIISLINPYKYNETIKHTYLKAEEILVMDSRKKRFMTIFNNALAARRLYNLINFIIDDFQEEFRLRTSLIQIKRALEERNNLLYEPQLVLFLKILEEFNYLKSKDKASYLHLGEESQKYIHFLTLLDTIAENFITDNVNIITQNIDSLIKMDKKIATLDHAINYLTIQGNSQVLVMEAKQMKRAIDQARANLTTEQKEEIQFLNELLEITTIGILKPTDEINLRRFDRIPFDAKRMSINTRLENNIKRFRHALGVAALLGLPGIATIIIPIVVYGSISTTCLVTAAILVFAATVCIGRASLNFFPQSKKLSLEKERFNTIDNTVSRAPTIFRRQVNQA